MKYSIEGEFRVFNIVLYIEHGISMLLSVTILTIAVHNLVRYIGKI